MELNDLAVFTRDMGDVVWGTKLTQANGDLDTTPIYAADDYLHTNLITFPNVFLSETRGRALLKRVVLFEYSTPLWKPDCRLLLFNKNECDISPVKNTVFNYTAATTLEHCIAFIDIIGADYKDQSHDDGSSKTYYSRAKTAILDEMLTNQVLDTTKAKSLDLVGLILVKGSNLSDYTTGSWIKAGLQVVKM